MMDLPDSFKSYLQSKNYSDSTIRNYLVDTNKFLDFIGHLSLEIGHLDNSVIQNYLSSIAPDPNFARYVSSLNKFFQFALDQNLISQNPLKKILKNLDNPPRSEIRDLKSILRLYQQQLETKKFSISTIRNYINDIQQYINFCETQKLNDQFPIPNDQKNLEIRY